MTRYLLLLVLVAITSAAFANDGDYAVSKIPDALRKSAHVVKRMEQLRFEISSNNKAHLYTKYALTVLDEGGDDYAYFYEYYDKQRSVESIEGRLFDADGKKIRSLKKGDVEDRSGVSGESLMEDVRLKLHSFYYKSYPYTVEYEFELSYDNTFIFPTWMPQPTEDYAVEQSSFSVECPSDYTFRYKMFNYSGQPSIVQEKNDKVYTWEVKSLPARQEEYAAPNWRTITTCVYFSPDKFKLDDYSGDLSSWDDFGKFIGQLNAGRDKLPDAIKQQVHQLTDHLTDAKEKVRVLYEYMQKNTRYVSVQLGIGSWQPFDATYVATKGYGDCKALSNYMYSLLEEAHIKSNYTLIKSGAGEKFFMDDFPCTQFDHIILFVPLQKDTMWLECTSQTLPAGYLSSFTADRYALAVTETGGKLVHTPKYGLSSNVQIRKINAVLEDDGTLTSNIYTNYAGLQQDGVHGLINSLSKDKVKEVLNSEFDFATYDVNKFEYKQNRTGDPTIEETLTISASNYATITGKRLFIIPNVMNRAMSRMKVEDDRKTDIVFNSAYKDVDSVEIEIPHGYTPESIPQPVSLETEFGKYSSSVKLDGDKIIFYRLREQHMGTYPAKDYGSLVNYGEAIYKADRNKVVLVKKDGN